MLIERDTDTGACYFGLSDAEVARTVHVDDLVMVDVDIHGDPVGVEFAAAPDDEDFERVYERFPQLRDVLAKAQHSLSV